MACLVQVNHLHEKNYSINLQKQNPHCYLCGDTMKEGRKKCCRLLQTPKIITMEHFLIPFWVQWMQEDQIYLMKISGSATQGEHRWEGIRAPGCMRHAVVCLGVYNVPGCGAGPGIGSVMCENLAINSGLIKLFLTILPPFTIIAITQHPFLSLILVLITSSFLLHHHYHYQNPSPFLILVNCPSPSSSQLLASFSLSEPHPHYKQHPFRF